MSALFDKRGIPIMPGDTLKVFHYISAVRREKRYMYKYVESIEFSGKTNTPLLKILHLSCDLKSYYYQVMDKRIMEEIEIVQGYAGVDSGYDYRDRPKNKWQDDGQMREDTTNAEAPLKEEKSNTWLDRLSEDEKQKYFEEMNEAEKEEMEGDK